MTKRPPLLDQVLTRAEEAKKEGRRFWAIFDLDSTLFNVSYRISKILHDFALQPEILNHYPDASKKLLELEAHDGDFGVKRTLARIGFVPPSEAFIKSIVEYWTKEFFGNNHLHLDRPYPGAKEFVLDLHKAGAEISYLTGRDIPRMKSGTIASLKQWGFPINDGDTNLLLKPSTDHSDSEFKKEFFQNLDKAIGEVWFFENEPTNIQLVYENCPHIHIVFVNTVHSQKIPEPGAHIAQIPGFII